MNTFGTIKTKIENVAVELAKDKSFKRFIFEFNGLVLNNKDISELYYIYDDLSSNRGVPVDLANDYINESIEYSQILLESQTKNISNLNNWINSWDKTTNNNYSNIDNVIYNTSIRNLESILESKKSIKNTLIKESTKQIKESSFLPLSSMVKIGNDSLNKEFSNISESDKKELTSILSLSGDEVKTEMDSLKESVINNLKTNLNESKDDSLKDSIGDTIKKINDSKVDHYNLYKLRKLHNGL
jgi:membrane-associated HD superfamily phosphohydrolase